MIRHSSCLAIALFLAVSSASLAEARGNDLTIKNGSGEEIEIKHGWFGRKHKVVKDRLGDKIEHKNGLFGSKETNVNVLGNTFRRKKGWFGGTNIEGTTVFGDKVTTKKGIFGRRKTTVDASGISSVINNLFADKSPASPLSMSKPGLPTDPLAPMPDINDLSGPGSGAAPAPAGK